MDINEKLNELLADPAFYQEGKDVASVEDFVELLHKHGVDLTAEEADAVLAQLGMLIAQQNGEELSEYDLDNVAGGLAKLVIGGIAVTIRGAAAGAVFGAGLGIAVGIAAIGVGCYYAKKKGWI